METRFLSHVEKTDDCWLWSPVRADGYGQTRHEGRSQNAHRVAYELWVGPVPDRHVVRHKCRNRHCVNPEHLETGTQAENEADKVRDGTIVRGERVNGAKLTEDQVRDIRNRVNQTYRELADEFGVGTSVIGEIIRRTCWKHIT
jgi:uncharacterized NAD-dependent epimerase/dehydratase family protein